MIDLNKRNTLKKIALGTGTLGAGMVTGGVAFAGDYTSELTISSADDMELGNIEISTRVSAANNDLEIVVTNAGQQSVNITHMTPHTVRVPRGEFKLSSLLKNGPVKLEAGESVSVPLKRMPIQMTASTLTDSLKNTVSVITDNNAFASVTIPGAVSV